MRVAALSCCAMTGCAERPAADSPPTKPNVLLLVADDLGWNDVGYHGSELRTPHIDALAGDGVKLGRFYAMSNCTPTRMGLLTGRYPIRWGMMNTVIRPWATAGLPPQEDTLAEMLAREGYEDRAVYGKWHLGHARREFHPLEQGFTEFYGHYNGAIDYFTHERAGEVDWHRGFEAVDEAGRYTTDLIGGAAVRFIERHARRPFFLLVSFNAPHTPLQAPPRCYKSVHDGLSPRRRDYAAVVSCMDDAIGRILDALDASGESDRTIVWFMSDNGGFGAGGASNAPLRGGKTEVYEGGIRVPSVVRWPDGGLTGGGRVDSMMGYIDVLPTLRAMIGAESPIARPFDGSDQLASLKGASPEPQRDWYTFTSMHAFRGDTGVEGLAVATREWKLVRVGPSILEDPEHAEATFELFRIREDPEERHDVAADHPEIVRELLRKLAEFRALQPEDALVPSPLRPPPGWRAPPRWRMPEDRSHGTWAHELVTGLGARAP